MLDECEYAEIATLYAESMKATKEFRERWNIPLLPITIEQQFMPVRLRYELLFVPDRSIYTLESSMTRQK